MRFAEHAMESAIQTAQAMRDKYTVRKECKQLALLLFTSDLFSENATGEGVQRSTARYELVRRRLQRP